VTWISDPLLDFLRDACTDEAPRLIRSPIVGYMASMERDIPHALIAFRPAVVTLEVDFMHCGLIPVGFGLSVDEAAGMAALGLCLSQGIEPSTLLTAAQQEPAL
jgi:hypothetical protein